MKKPRFHRILVFFLMFFLSGSHLALADGLIIRNGSTLTMNGSTLNLNCKDLTIQNGGTFNFVSGTVDNCGDLIDDYGGLIQGSGTFFYCSSTPGTVSINPDPDSIAAPWSLDIPGPADHIGNGDQTRDFTWVEDSARGIISAAECDELVGDCVNIARGQEVSILSVCELVLKKLGRQDLKPLYLDDGRPGDVDRHYADISKAQRLLGFSPSVDLESGLDRYIQWVEAQDPDLEAWVKQDKTRNW